MDAAVPRPRRVAAPTAQGHRERLRQRFAEGGASALPDYELMELLLFNSIPQRDVKPLARVLIDTFGSFADAISAPSDQLANLRVAIPGQPDLTVGPKTQIQFQLIRAAALRLAQANVRARPILSSWAVLRDYCRATTAYEGVEQFRVLFLNSRNELIADECQQTGTVNHTPVYPREVVKRALQLNASALILVHNHPSGDPTPSRADVDMTKRIVEAAAAVDIVVHDHLVVGRGAEASLKSLGLM